MSKSLARMVLSDATNRPVLVSAHYANSLTGPEVTSGRMLLDIDSISNAVLAEEIAATTELARSTSGTTMIFGVRDPRYRPDSFADRFEEVGYIPGRSSGNSLPKEDWLILKRPIGGE